MLVFLSKTKRSKVDTDKIRTELGDLFGVHVDARRRAGWLALLWHTSVQLNSLYYSSNHIDVVV